MPDTPDWRSDLGLNGHDDTEATIKRLADLRLLDYARIREAEAKRLEIPVSWLDRAVKAQQKVGLSLFRGQGQPVSLPPPESWPEAVSGAALLDELTAFFARHLAAPEHAHQVMALWAVHCHCFECFEFTPRLQFKAPTKGSGKSTAIGLLKLVTPKPIEVETISTAFLFRVIEVTRCTVLLDEADKYVPNDDELIATINAGFKRGGMAGRCVGEEQEPRLFSCHAPMALADNRALPSTIEDRSICITLKRRLKEERADPVDDEAKELALRLQRQACRWALDCGSALRAARPNMGELINRPADRWRPLFAVADLAGGQWPGRARRAMLELRLWDEDGWSLGEQVLADIRAGLGELEEQIPSPTLIERLLRLEGRSWQEMPRSGKPITPNRLAKLLKPFGIFPRDLWIEGRCIKGYVRRAFDEAFCRYLPPEEGA